MFLINIITKIDGSISVGIVVHEEVIGDIDNISTVPSSITWDNVEWTIWAVNLTITWTVFVSVFIFNHNNTVVNFTGIKGTI